MFAIGSDPPERIRRPEPAVHEQVWRVSRLWNNQNVCIGGYVWPGLGARRTKQKSCLVGLQIHGEDLAFVPSSLQKHLVPANRTKPAAILVQMKHLPQRVRPSIHFPQAFDG